MWQRERKTSDATQVDRNRYPPGSNFKRTESGSSVQGSGDLAFLTVCYGFDATTDGRGGFAGLKNECPRHRGRTTGLQ